MKFKNNKGYSLIELLVVIAILVTATAIAGGGISSAYHSRTEKAVKDYDGMISQSKINAMTGRSNYLDLTYDSDSKQYICYLVKRSNGTVYETAELGNQKITVTVDGTQLNAEQGDILRMSFNMDTGAVKECKIITSSSEIDKLQPEIKITVSSFGSRTITLYQSTGEHTFN